MNPSSQLTVRPVIEQDRSRLASLIHFQFLVHRHLDWRPPLDWLGHEPFLVAERGDKLLAALVCPPDPPEVAWIRLFAVAAEFPVEKAWQVLWPAAQSYLASRMESEVAAIPLQQWFGSLLEKSGFTHTRDVITLMWTRGRPLPEAHHSSVAIRAMLPDDLPAVAGLDRAAFGPTWRNSLESLEMACQQAVIATVAQAGDQLAGYQISTPTPMGGHLARLAVHPQFQRQGVGYALLRDMLDQLSRRGAMRVTVNTQKDNHASLKLYDKAGFERTSEAYPVYQCRP